MTFFSRLGTICGWLLLAVVVCQFVVVAGRQVLSLNLLWAQELVLVLHSLTLLLAIPVALAHRRHIRIELFSRSARDGVGVSWFDRAGFILLVVPLAGVLVVTFFPYVAESWAIFEGSTELSGLPGKFIQKSVLLVFALLLPVAVFFSLRRGA